MENAVNHIINDQCHNNKSDCNTAQLKEEQTTERENKK